MQIVAYSLSLWLDVLLKILFSLSALGKVKALVGPTGHPLFGPGKLYPSWFLPIALSTELLFVGGLVLLGP